MITVAVTMLFTTTSPKLTPSLVCLFDYTGFLNPVCRNRGLPWRSALPRIDRLLWFFPRGSPLYAELLRSPAVPVPALFSLCFSPCHSRVKPYLFPDCHSLDCRSLAAAQAFLPRPPAFSFGLPFSAALFAHLSILLFVHQSLLWTF